MTTEQREGTPAEGSPGSFFDLSYAAWRARQDPDPAERTHWQDEYRSRRQAFEASPNGGEILLEYWCTTCQAGAVLTADAVHVDTPDDMPLRLQELVFTCHRLVKDVEQYLEAPELASERKRCLAIVYTPLTYLLSYVDLHNSRKDATYLNPRLALVAREIAHARSTFLTIVKRLAFKAYFAGAWTWAAGILAASLVAAVVVALTWPDGSGVAHLLAALAAGAAGGAVSVLTRMTNGKLRVDHKIGWELVQRTGRFRPVIGAVFGVAVALAIGAELLSVDVPEDTVTRLSLFGFAGFLAGFSERWAQDMLGAGERALTPAAPPPGERDPLESALPDAAER